MEQLFFAYEKGHLDAIPKGATVIALDRELEYLLEERGISYISAKEFRDTDPFERLVFADEYVHALFKSDAWKFFTYRNISLGTLFAFPLQEYLDFLLYYTSIYRRIAEAYPKHSWYICPPTQPPPRAGASLALHMYNVAVRAAALVAKEKGIAYTVAPHIKEMHITWREYAFAFQRGMFGIALTVLNTAVTFLVQPKPIALVVSDYWRHISPFLKDLPNAEITLLDRSEFRHIPLRVIWSNRIRFVHLRAPSALKQKRKRTATELRSAWSAAQHNLPEAQYDNVQVSAAVKDALDTIFEVAVSGVLEQIDGAYALLECKPTAVLLRTSVGGQTHFGVLALVAHASGVPAIELQHGLEYLGPGSMSTEHAAQYVAIYGPAIAEEFKRIGYDASRLIQIGSPRFDVYAGYEPMANGSVVVIGPDVYLGGSTDSYDTEEYFTSLFEGIPVSEQIVIKLRSGVRKDFFYSCIERVKKSHSPRIETLRPLPELYKEAKIVVSCYSTSILESLQCGIPTVLLGSSKIDAQVGHTHFDRYVEAGVFALAANAHELTQSVQVIDRDYAQLVKKIKNFMAQNYLFDGKAGERMAAYLASRTG